MFLFHMLWSGENRQEKSRLCPLVKLFFRHLPHIMFIRKGGIEPALKFLGGFKKMKKRLFAFALLAAMLVGLLSGCGAKKAETPAAEDGVVVINYRRCGVRYAQGAQ